MKEIGGYFGLAQFSGCEYYPELLKLNTARNALVYLCKAKNIQKVYLPYFLCDSVAAVCQREGICYEQYHICKDFTPNFTGVVEDHEALYVVNYYGQLSTETILSLQDRYKHIIVDNVQAFFQKPLPGIDTIYSCRKFFGVPDGAYLATDTLLPHPLAQDRSASRMQHILGRFEDTASAYYDTFRQNDASFRSLPLLQMSPLTENLLRAVDYQTAAQIRQENWAFLHEKLAAKNPLCLHTPVGPYAYPFYCENGMEIKRQLAKEGIYIATLWPNVLQEEHSLENDYARNILPLVCDQRYNTQDIDTMYRMLLNYI